jgi:hypothetical protein
MRGSVKKDGAGMPLFLQNSFRRNLSLEILKLSSEGRLYLKFKFPFSLIKFKKNNVVSSSTGIYTTTSFEKALPIDNKSSLNRV